MRVDCAAWHRPGGAGPFSLLTYEQAKRRTSLIAAVTKMRCMPPWQPAPGTVRFKGERRLTDTEIDLLSRWAEQGAPLGDPAALSPPPKFDAGWQLGRPDLVVCLDEPFSLRADGVDEFRNFALPVPVKVPRYVRALEFRPGNPGVVHHAVMQVDRSRDARRRDAADPGPGFGGVDLGNAENPGVSSSDGRRGRRLRRIRDWRGNWNQAPIWFYNSICYPAAK